MDNKKITEANLELAKDYLNQMKDLLELGQNFQFGKVRKDFESLLDSMGRGNYFSVEQIDTLNEKYKSFAHPTLLAHLQESF